VTTGWREAPTPASEASDPRASWPSDKLLVLALFVLALLLRLACFTGLIASDDLDYVRYARLMADGQYAPEYSHWAIRYTVLFPVALAYRLFGVSEWTTVVVPLMASAASVALVGVIGRRLFGTIAGTVAALLLATSPVHLRYATVLVPEPMLEFLMLAGIWVYVRYSGSAALSWGVLSGVFLGGAYLAKESAAFVVPAVLIHAAARRDWRRAATVMAGVLLIVVLEHTYYIATTGDPLFRLHALAGHNRNISRMVADTGATESRPVVPAVSNTSAKPSGSTAAPAPSAVPARANVPHTDTAAPSPPAAASDAPSSTTKRPLEHTHELPPSTVRSHFNLGYRLLKSYPRLMLLPNDHLGLHSIFALLFAAGAFLLWRRDHRAQLLFFWAALPWLYLNLGTTSLTQYLPIPPSSRYISLTYPPLFLLAGWMVAALWGAAKTPGRRWLIATPLAVVLVSGLLIGLETRASGYRTSQVAVLRAMTPKLRGLSVCYDVHPRLQSHWERALAVLSGGDVGACDLNRPHVVLRADRAGLPAIAQ
jgi:4-amino-4-deoxy-L-arabinose transferase-like glycosyltransferase